MRASGTNKDGKTVVASKSGLTGHFTKVTGKMIRQMEEAASSTPMVTFTMAIGKMIKHTDMVSTTTLMARGTRAGGLKTNNTVRAKRSSQILELNYYQNIKSQLSSFLGE